MAAPLTRTDLPESGGKYRKHQSNKYECAHRWSANKQPEGQAGRVYFSNGVIYSYGQHFPIARHVRRYSERDKRKFILFTTRSYSSSTASHKSAVRSAIPSDATVFEVYDVRADSREDHIANLRAIECEAHQEIKKAAKARKNKPFHRSQALHLIKSGNAYADAVGLRRRLKAPEEGKLDEWAKEVEEAAAKAIAAERKAQAKKRAEEWKKFSAELSAWQAGGDKVPGNGRGPDGVCYVRVSRGKYLQTTLGMTVPLKEVMPVLDQLREGRAPISTGESQQEYRFKIQDWDGELNFEENIFRIGCHTITFDEILRAASAAGL